MLQKRYNKAPSRIAKKHKTKKYLSIFFGITLVMVFFIGSFYILRADFLQVKDFEILGVENAQTEAIENTASSFISGTKFFLLPKSNMIFLSKEKLTAQLLASFNRLETVEVNKQFFSKNVEISVKERRADFLWCLPAQAGSDQTESCFFMNKDGLVFEKSDLIGNVFESSPVNEAEPINKIVFRGKLEGNPLMKNFATLEEMQNFLSLAQVFENAGFKIISINIESPDKAVAKSNIGNIVFNPSEANLSLTAENTVLLINDIRSKNPSARFQYIDARFGNKMFYKLI